jgi:hypothetical protein
MRTITVMTQNRAGLLSDMSYILGKNKINIEGLDVDEVGEKVVIDITVRNSEKTIDVLKKNGFEIIERKGLLLRAGRDPNKLEELKQKLTERGIKISNEEVICSGGERTILSLNVNHPRRANKVLASMAF